MNHVADPIAPARSHAQKGYQHEQTRAWQDAISYYSAAISLVPSLEAVHWHRGMCYEKVGDYLHAVEDYSSALELDPNNTAIIRKRAALFSKQKQYTAAIVDYQFVAHLSPFEWQDLCRIPHAEALYWRGAQKAQSNDFEGAAADLNDAMQIAPEATDKITDTLLKVYRRKSDAQSAYDENFQRLQQAEAQRQAEFDTKQQSELDAQHQAGLKAHQAELKAQRKGKREAQRRAEDEAKRKEELEAQHLAELVVQHQTEIEKQHRTELKAHRRAKRKAQRQVEEAKHQKENEGQEQPGFDLQRQNQLDLHSQQGLTITLQADDVFRTKIAGREHRIENSDELGAFFDELGLAGLCIPSGTNTDGVFPERIEYVLNVPSSFLVNFDWWEKTIDISDGIGRNCSPCIKIDVSQIRTGITASAELGVKNQQSVILNLQAENTSATNLNGRVNLNVTLAKDNIARLKLGGKSCQVQNSDELIRGLLAAGYRGQHRDAEVNSYGTFPERFEFELLVDDQFLASTNWWVETAQIDNGRDRNAISLILIDCAKVQAVLSENAELETQRQAEPEAQKQEELNAQRKAKRDAQRHAVQEKNQETPGQPNLTAALFVNRADDGALTLSYQGKDGSTTYLPRVTQESFNAFVGSATGKTRGVHEDGGAWVRFPMADRVWGMDNKGQPERDEHKSKVTGEIYFTCTKPDILSTLAQWNETAASDVDEPQLDSIAQQVYQLIENTNKCVFVTGKAGTGKSFLLQYFIAHTKKQVVVLASTGVAAMNVGGVTIHSFFHFYPHFMNPSEIHPVSAALQKTYKAVDVIVIDEISMVRADMIDNIDQFMRINGRNSKLPFGGAQLVVFGDLYQLPPIVARPEERLFLSKKYRSEWFFDAEVFVRLEINIQELITVYRQHDLAFIEILDAIRLDQVRPQHLQTLQTRVNPAFEPLEDQKFITLTTINDLARAINSRKLANLNTPEYVFDGITKDEFPESYMQTDKELLLKVGAQVMFVRNDISHVYVNGTIGTIVELGKNLVKVEIPGRGISNVEQVVWGHYKYIYNIETSEIAKSLLGTFTQYPLKLAWAITIHKSQGLTFDNVIIDLGTGAFTNGQTYVALSRCRTLESIVLRHPLRRADIKTDVRVTEFFAGERGGDDGVIPF